ncbi:MAG: hypothetical protein BAJATHORv1_120025 [Candidatus Thorarchaeota archaeon]|nr:MAG: hypothetical protein BAJATHORv1_120025 [Candidatus Thorarchaeota archaeon]
MERNAKRWERAAGPVSAAEHTEASSVPMACICADAVLEKQQRR